MTEARNILIADDDPALVQALSLRCQSMGLNVSSASNGLKAMLEIKTSPPDLLILDIDMPQADGFKVCERLSQTGMGRFPVIILSGRSDEQTKERCAQLGVPFVHKGATYWEALEPLIESALDPEQQEGGLLCDDAAAQPERRTRVLVVDDDADVTRAIAIRLGYYGIDAVVSSDGFEGYLTALKEKPDLVITDYNMPRSSGDYLIVKLKGHADTRDIPVIVLTGETDRTGRNVPLRREMMGRRGAAAFLVKPLNFDALIEEMQRQLRMPLSIDGAKEAARGVM